MNGLLFEPDNEGSFLEVLASVPDDRQAAALRVEAGLVIARRQFDWSVIVAGHERCFAETIGQWTRGTVPAPRVPANDQGMLVVADQDGV